MPGESRHKDPRAKYQGFQSKSLPWWDKTGRAKRKTERRIGDAVNIFHTANAWCKPSRRHNPERGITKRLLRQATEERVRLERELDISTRLGTFTRNHSKGTFTMGWRMEEHDAYAYFASLPTVLHLYADIIAIAA